MDIEQLKLIIDAATAAGDSAFWLVVLWLSKDFIIALIGFSLLAGVLYVAYRLVTDLIRKSSFENDVMAALGISVYMDSGDKRRAIEWMLKGKKAGQ